MRMSMFTATLGVQKHLVVQARSSDKSPQSGNKRRSGVARAQPKQNKSEEAVVFTSPSLNGATPVVEKADIKVPSANVNIIPISRWPTGIPPAMGGHYMSSGSLAPLSNSKGPGIDIAPLYFTYPSGESEVDVTVYENDFAAANGLADLVAKASQNAIAKKGSFTIALSGGSLVKTLSALVSRTDIDFSKWYVLFVDERVVPHSSVDSNYKAAQQDLLSKVPIPSSHVIAIKEGLSTNLAAEHYAGQLLDLPNGVLPRTANDFPVIDLVLLGVGPDGHVASLFPNRKETAATTGWVLPVTDSPKPPSDRITLTVPVLNAARQVAVVALGQSKAEVIQRALEVQSLPGALPVQLMKPDGGRLSYVLDKASASGLQIAEWENTKLFPRST